MNSKRTHTIAAGCVLASFVTAGFCSGDPMSSMAPPGVIFELLALNRDLPTKANPKYLSTMEMIASPDSQTLYVSEKNAKQIGVIDLTAKTLKKNIKLPNDVTGIAVAPDGKKIYATCASDLWPAGILTGKRCTYATFLITMSLLLIWPLERKPREFR
jgi:hypothetical protein